MNYKLVDMKKNTTIKVKSGLVSGLLLLFASGLSAQTISGKVLSATGAGISNALVLSEANPAVFVKTSSTGTYSIPGVAGMKLRVAALHYETKKNVNVTASSNFNVTLAEDALEASGDIYHINFDHIRPGKSISSTEIRDDFPVASSSGFDEGTAESDRADIDRTISRDPGGQSLKVRFPKGQVVTCCSGVDLRIPLKNTYKDNDFKADELYLSYWVKFKDDWEWDKCGGKMPSIGGSEFNSREKTWKGRIMWANQGTIRFYPEMPKPFSGANYDNGIDSEDRFWGASASKNNDICNQDDRTKYLKPSGWHNIELHYVMDKGPGTTGYFEGWIDGESTSNKITSDKFNYFRIAGNENITMNAILISFFHGGSSDVVWQPNKDEFCWLDEFRVSDSRIKDYLRFPATVTTTDEVTATEELSIFPNPSEGIFNLSKATSWAVITNIGEVVLEGEGKEINLEEFNKGIYILKTAVGNFKISKE
jgi:hypothetical protein